MNTLKLNFSLMALAIILLLSVMNSCKLTDKEENPDFEKISQNTNAQGQLLEIRVTEGPEHTHPLMAFWLESKNGEFIQTLFVAKSIGKGVFEHGKAEKGKWMPGKIQRPAALPVWSHLHQDKKNKYGNYLPTPENPVPDTYTGATPTHSFALNVKPDKPIKEKVKLRMEINQPFDWNEHWTNTKYPDEDAYETSGQPAIVYEGMINPKYPDSAFTLKAIGHSHYAGKNGKIYGDLSTITSAQKIVRSVTVSIKEK